MDKPEKRFGLFGLKERGIGLRVTTTDRRLVSHEVLFEEDVTQLKERPLFLGFPLPRRRFYLAFIVTGLLIGALIIQAFRMQVLQGEAFRIRAERNRLRHETIIARRGIIRDRNGTVLAENIPSFELQAMPRLLPADADTRDEVLANVGRETGASLADLQAIIASSTDYDDRVTLVRDVPYARAVALSVLIGTDPSLQVVVGNKRRYPFSSSIESLSHVLGYVGPISRSELEKVDASYRQTDTIGKTGIEASFESKLRGVSGERLYEVDAKNRITSLVGDRKPEDGSDLTLTIDVRLQRAAEEALRRRLEQSRLHRGSIVVMDPRDGSILALVSLPAYDNNFFSGSVSSTYYASLLQNEDHPLLPRAFAGTYPSGSTVKPVIAAAGLAEKVITPQTTVHSVGGVRIGTSFFPDWKAGGHGLTNVRKAIAWSVNTFFYNVGGGYDSFIGLGVDRLTTWMRRFGLGSKSGLDLPGENSGFVPSREWKEQAKHERWYVGDTYNLSIGQGDLLVTPLQVALFTAEIANGGKRIRPHLAAADILDHPENGESIVDGVTVRTVQLGMRDTVLYGSGRSLASFPVSVAGKTGTAQWRNDRPNHAWFTAFAPFENPEIVVTVLLEEGGEGSSVAVPVARDVLQAWVGIRHIP